MIRTVDPRCRECGRALLDDLSRRRRVGPDCWARMTPDEQQHALELAARERDPHYIPPERAPSVQARVNHHNVQAAVAAPEARLCRHENLAGACPDCRREADPHRAAELILRSVLEQTFEARRAERAEILARRYENGPPPIGARPLKPRRPARRATTTPTPAAPAQAQQMELL